MNSTAIQDHRDNFVNRIFLVETAWDVDEPPAMVALYLAARTFARPDIQYGKQAAWQTGGMTNRDAVV